MRVKLAAVDEVLLEVPVAQECFRITLSALVELARDRLGQAEVRRLHLERVDEDRPALHARVVNVHLVVTTGHRGDHRLRERQRVGDLVRHRGVLPSVRSNTSTGKFDSIPPSTRKSFCLVLSLRIFAGSKKNGIDMLARTASTTST